MEINTVGVDFFIESIEEFQQENCEEATEEGEGTNVHTVGVGREKLREQMYFLSAGATEPMEGTTGIPPAG